MAELDQDEVGRALSLLVHASRVSPPLRQAVAVVEAEVERLREAVALLPTLRLHIRNRLRDEALAAQIDEALRAAGVE